MLFLASSLLGVSGAGSEAACSWDRYLMELKPFSEAFKRKIPIGEI
jgi:hypothetical protein